MIIEFLQKNKARIITILILTVLLVIGMVVYFTRPGSVVIRTDPGTDIFIASSRDSEFKKIGTEIATYRTRNVPAITYIMVSQDNKKTITSTYIQRGREQSVTLKTKTTVKATKITDGAVSNAIINGSQIQGIVPDDYSLINLRTDAMEMIRPEFVGLPYMKKIVWYDMNNFVYKTFNKGVGRFINGANTGITGLADKLSGKDLPEINTIEGDGLLELSDASRSEGQPLVLMSNSNIFTSNDMGSSLQSIISFDELKDGETHSLFTTKRYIYRFTSSEPAAYASESNAEDNTQKEEHGSLLYQYDYNGNEIGHYSIDSHSDIRSIVDKDGRTYVLTPEKLITIKDSKIHDLDLYFTFVRDLTLFKDTVMLLGDQGVWQVSEDAMSVHLLYEFTDSGVGLAQSFSNSGDKLVFGTQAKPSDQNIITKMYALEF